MPAGSERVPKYCLFRPRGLAYVRIERRVHYLGKYNSPESWEAYGRIVAEWKATRAGAPQALLPVQSMTVVELCAAFLDFAEGYYVKDGRPTDQMGTVRRAIRVTKELYGHTLAKDFGPLAFRAIQEHLVGTEVIHPRTRRRIHYTRSTINGTCGCIRRMFKWATSHELVPVVVYQALLTVPGLKKGRTPARDPKPVPPVADAVVEATVPHLSPVVADMVWFQRLTGARPGEVCELRPMDVDRSREVWEYRPASHKTEHHGRERVIFIGPKAQAILLPYLLRPLEAQCFSPAESEQKRHAAMREDRKTRVQPSQAKRRKTRPRRAPSTSYGRDSYRRAIRKAIRKANRKEDKQAAKEGREPRPIPIWHPNQLRHSAATEIRRKFGLEAAQTVLGHAKADVTQVYAERDHALAADVMSKIG